MPREGLYPKNAGAIRRVCPGKGCIQRMQEQFEGYAQGRAQLYLESLRMQEQFEGYAQGRAPFYLESLRMQEQFEGYSQGRAVSYFCRSKK